MSSATRTALLRVVLDSNLFISGLVFPAGKNAVLWSAAKAGRYRLVLSPAIVNEVARVLRTKFKWPEDEIQEAIRRVVRVADAGLVTPTVVVEVVSDPDDNRILECALAGKADLIVTNDNHLLSLKSWENIPIVAAADFRRTLGLK